MLEENIDFNNGEYKDIIKIGKGTFGEIYKAKTLFEEEVVLKVIHFTSKRKKNQFISEVKNRQKLGSHPNLLPLSSCYYNQNLGVIVLEKMECDLMNYLISMPSGRIPEKKAKKMFFQIALALYHCHAHAISHLDVKPDNILLSFHPHRPSTIQSIKLADFGCSFDFSGHPISPPPISTEISSPPSLSSKSSPTTSSNSPTSSPIWTQGENEWISPSKLYNFVFNEVRGTKEYLPPETLIASDRISPNNMQTCNGNEREYHADKVDIWGLGVTLFAMITGSFPYALVDGKLIGNDLSLVCRYTSDNLCYDLVCNMLHKNPDLRFDISQVLLHPWLSSFSIPIV